MNFLYKYIIFTTEKSKYSSFEKITAALIYNLHLKNIII